MALRAGPPRAPELGGRGGPCGEGAWPHCSVGASGEPGQCRVAGGGGGDRRVQAEGMPVLRPSHARHEVTAAGVGLIHGFAETWGQQGQPSDGSRAPWPSPPDGSQTTEASGKIPPIHSHQGANREAFLEVGGGALPMGPPLSALRQAGKRGQPALSSLGSQGDPHPQGHREAQVLTTASGEDPGLLLHKQSGGPGMPGF